MLDLKTSKAPPCKPTGTIRSTFRVGRNVLIVGDLSFVKRKRNEGESKGHREEVDVFGAHPGQYSGK